MSRREGTFVAAHGNGDGRILHAGVAESAPLASQLHLPVLAAKAVTAALVFFFNYSLRKHLLFTRSAAVTRS